jgi:cell division protein FtsW (lipid II flippase)
MLAAVLMLGKKIKGQTSWFSIAGFGIQPSEFAKVATVPRFALSSCQAKHRMLM